MGFATHKKENFMAFVEEHLKKPKTFKLCKMQKEFIKMALKYPDKRLVIRPYSRPSGYVMCLRGCDEVS